MAHGISNDIHTNLVGHHTVLGGIARVVDPFPGVAQITVASDEDHKAAVLVLDAQVMRRHATLFVSDALNQGRDSGYLDHTVEVEVAVEDWMCKR